MSGIMSMSLTGYRRYTVTPDRASDIVTSVGYLTPPAIGIESTPDYRLKGPMALMSPPKDTSWQSGVNRIAKDCPYGKVPNQLHQNSNPVPEIQNGSKTAHT